MAERGPLSAAMVEPVPARSYVLYDHHVMQVNGHLVVAVDVTVSLQEFHFNHQMVLDVNSFSMDPHGVPYLPGEISTCWFSIATEIGRKVARSLIKKLIMMEADGCCVDNLQEVHIRLFPSVKVKLHGVNFLTREELGDNAYFDALHGNYVVIASLIQGLFIGAASIPTDVEHLLDLMLNQNQFEHRALFLAHAGIIPFKDYPGLFMFLRDLVTYPVAVITCEEVCLQIGQNTDWQVTII